MKFYKAGKRVKHIDEMEKGKVYNVCGIVGKLSTAPTPTGENVYKLESPSERIWLLLGREELMDRIHFGMVYNIIKEYTPRPKTLAKLL